MLCGNKPAERSAKISLNKKGDTKMVVVEKHKRSRKRETSRLDHAHSVGVKKKQISEP